MLEIIFSAVADAVIGKAIDVALAPLNLDERLAKRIRGDPAKLAFQKALARAYTGFVRSYPELGTQLFTEPFLTNEAAVELAALTVGREPDPVHFAHLWVETPRHHVTSRALVDANGKPTNLAVDAAQHFLHLLRAELRHDEVFRPVFDSQALDHLPEIANSLADLNKALQQALKEAVGYSTRIQGNVDMGGGDFVARDKVITNYYFTGNYAKLELFYDPPDYIYNRVEVDSFVGRRQLQEQIQQFIHTEDRDNGLLLIEGEAGLGKTALMAHLVREHGYFHVFGDRFNGEGRRSEAVAHLAAQIVSRFQIEGYRDGVSLEIAQSSRFLQRVMEAAAAKLSRGERIVLVYDALDQAGLPTQDHNPLGLPMALPKGVFVIASQRPVQQPPKCDVLRETIKLEARDANNLDDILEFLRMKAAHDRKIRLKLGPYSADDFVRILSERASGNWMYLYFVLAEIERGRRGNPLALDKLPNGLNAYYCEYWQHWRTDISGRINPEWQQVYAPMLGILGAVDEPISLVQMLDWTGLKVQQDVVVDLLTRQWRAFVLEHRERADDGRLGESKYQFVHRSLVRFMRGEGEDGLGVQEQRFIRVLAEQTKQAHQMIVNHFRTHCGGVWHQLVIDSYARRNLSRHLFEVERGTLFEMVAMSDAWAKAREQREESYAGYLVDLDYAWRYADQATGWSGLGDQIRCALIKSSIHTLASNLSPQLLKLLVETKLWSPFKALQHALQISEQWQRSNAIVGLFRLLSEDLRGDTINAIKGIKNEYVSVVTLSELVRYLDDAQRAQVVAEVLAAVREIKNAYTKAEILMRMIAYLDGAQKAEIVAEALEAARKIEHKAAKAIVLAGLVVCLNGAQKEDVIYEALEVALESRDTSIIVKIATKVVVYLDGALKAEGIAEALAGVREIRDEADRVRALTELAMYLDSAQKDEALAVAGEIKGESARAQVLIALAAHLNGVQKEEALSMAREIKDESARAQVLTELAAYLDGAQKEEVFGEALEIAWEIADRLAWVKTWINVIAYLGGSLKAEIIAEVLARAREIEQKDSRVLALTELSIYLNGAQQAEVVAEVLAAVREIKDEHAHAKALTELPVYLDGAQKVEVIAEALATIKKVESEYGRAYALTELAAHLDDAHKTEALTVAREIEDEDDRAQALTGLVAHLHGEQKVEAIAEALATIIKVESEYGRANALTELAAYLDDAHKTEALTVAREIEDEDDRAQALTGLAAHLYGDQKAKVVAEVLATIKKIDNEYGRAHALTGLAVHLDGVQKDEALGVAREITSVFSRAEALTGLAAQLDDAQKAEALTTAREIEDENFRAEALTRLVVHLDDAHKAKVVAEALAVARSIKYGFSRTSALTEVAPHLIGPEKTRVVGEALVAVREVNDESFRMRALIGLAIHLDGAQKDEALAVAKEIRDESTRVRALAELSIYLDGVRKVEVITEVLELVSIMPVAISRDLYLHIYSDTIFSLITKSWQVIGFTGFESTLWYKVLGMLAKRPRSECIEALTGLFPLLRHLAGSRADIAGEILHAIRDTARWWP